MDLEKRIIDLESLGTFQEDKLESLSQVLIRQQAEIDELRQQLKKLQDFLESSGDQGIKDIKDETPPPHY